MQNKIEKTSSILFAISIILVLFLVIPQFPAASILPRESAVMILSLSLLILYSLKILKSDKLEVYSTPLGLPLFLWLLANIGSLIASPGKYDPLFTVSVFVPLFIIYMVLPQLIHSTKNIAGILITGLIAVSSLGLVPSIAKKIPIPSGTFSGLPFTAGILLLISFPVFLGVALTLFQKIRHRRKLIALHTPALLLVTVLFVISSAVTINTLKPFTKNSPEIPQFLDRQVGWIIAVESIKNHPFFGLGSGNFVNAYTLYKPLYAPNISYPDLNFTPSTNSSNEYFQILTTVGILGFAAYFLFALKSIFLLKTSLKSSNSIEISLSISFIIFLILQAFFPAPYIVTFLAFFFLSLYQCQKNREPQNLIELPKESPDSISFKSIPLALSIVILIGAGYLIYRLLAGEFYQNKTIQAVAENNAQKAFENGQKSVDFNPMNDVYRANLAQIAYSIGVTTLQQKSQNLTDEDKTLISNLFQKAISEGREAVNINPQKVYNLSILATIYAGLSKAVPGTEQFSIDVYNKAISVDPTNPQIRVALGGIYFGKSEFATASAIFRNAVFLQANYANAHYNLGESLIRLNQFDEGIKELEASAQILPEGNADRERVLKEIEDIKAQIASISASPSASGKPASTQLPTKTPAVIPSAAPNP